MRSKKAKSKLLCHLSGFKRVTSLLGNVWVILFLFFMITTLASLAQVYRWTISDPVALVDHYSNYGTIFPDFKSLTPHGGSTYFPGVTLLGICLNFLVSRDYLTEIMLIVASLTMTLFVIVQIKMVQQIDERIHVDKFTPFMLACVILLAPMYWFYGREFKPDTIATLFGFLGLLIARMESSKSHTRNLILGAFLCSLGLVFKQQHIAFVLGVFGFCVFFRNKNTIIFATSLTFFTSFILFTFYQNPNLWFFTVTAVAQHGFLSFETYFALNETTFDNLLGFVVIISIATLTFTATPLKRVSINYLGRALNISWVWGVLAAALAAFLSAWKVGGNAGNTQLGLILLIPIIIPLLCNIRKEFFVLAFWYAIYDFTPTLNTAHEKYIAALNLKQFVADNPVNPNAAVVVGSNVYFAARAQVDQPIFINYWVLGAYPQYLKQLAGEQYEPSVAALFHQQPERIIIENWPENIKAIQANGHYDILFQNSLGIVAQRKE